MNNEKEAVALGSIAASGAMTVGKFAVGLSTGSLGLISEGAHSLLDLGATVMTYLAVRVSDKPADAGHPYGHGKIESVTALGETGLLFLTSAWIAYEAVHRLVTGDAEVQATWWSIGAVLVSIAIDAYRAHELSRVARETRSQALEADALHFSSDILSSAVVLVGLGLVWLGYPKGDALAAIGVSVFVCLAGYRLGRRTIDTLIDAAPAGAAERVAAIVSAIPGIAGVRRVRVRPAGSVLFVDLDLLVGRTLPLEAVQALRDRAVAAIGTEMPEAEVSIATHPLALDDETVMERVMVRAANLGLAVHHVTVQRVSGRLSVGFDLEVEGGLTIQAAHDLSSRLESAIKDELGSDIEVESHIEPLQDAGLNGTDADLGRLAEMQSQMTAFIRRDGRLLDIHNLRVRQTAAGLVVTFHSHVVPTDTVVTIHDAMDALERHIRDLHPDIVRVVGHSEPDHDGPLSIPSATGASADAAHSA
ncbi:MULTISPECIES: cation diffusion facilitator family transporter [unclassified Azospirillum]|uniref:cation diffusion facilitator family transporter n=1 Tax=unclassified Azospirillum TaxID=2630922 RepID=UPI000D6229EF|nr:MULTISPECIES: cation diffusion facilitator family transporter [unclassified Azospirillum]PWC91091.1 cation diffusion facilitator family transporter [Azospirillum sp. TSO5]QCG99311.1 cation transporter [Azospirillum sp. TSA2s]